MPAIELVIFKAKTGISDADMRRAAQAILPDVQRLDGFISRHFGCDDNGTYADVIIWTDKAAADQAAQDVMQIPSCGAFFALIEPSSIEMRHFN